MSSSAAAWAPSARGTRWPRSAELIEAGRFRLPVARTFPLDEIAEAHRISESGHPRGKLVLLVGVSGPNAPGRSSRRCRSPIRRKPGRRSASRCRGDGVVVLGGVELWLDAAGRGITGWTLRRISLHHDVDGLSTGTTTDPPPPETDHPNGAMGIDHVVVTTPEFDRTAAALEDAGVPLRRIRDAGGFRQGFRRLGPAIVEIVEAPHRVHGSRVGAT